MSKITIEPNVSGTGEFKIASPGTSINRTLTLPDADGTLITSESADFASAVGTNKTFRNKLINGDFRINQRGVISVLSSIQYFADRWMISWGAGSTPSLTAGIVANSGFTSEKCGYVYGTFNSNMTYLLQKLEANDCACMRNKTVTLSGSFYQDSGATITVTPSASYANTADNFSAYSNIATGTPISLPSGVLTKFSWTFDAGLNVVNGLLALLTVSSITGVAKNLYFGDMQLEIGSVATPFEQRPIGFEFGMCQRYRQAVIGNLMGYQTAGGQIAAHINWPTQMRITPTYVISGGSYNNGSGASLASAFPTGGRFSFVATATGSAYAADFVITLDAEL